MKLRFKIYLKIFMLCLCLLCFQDLCPQTGLYKSKEAFFKGILTHGEKHTHVKLAGIFNKNTIRLKCNDTVYVYSKNEVYGCKDKGGNVYRFFKNETYVLINPKESISLYSKNSGTGLKNSPIAENYYFSRNAGTEIFVLNLPNLLNVFSDKPNFRKFLEIFYRKEDDLIAYDFTQQMYKLNRLLQLSEN